MDRRCQVSCGMSRGPEQCSERGLHVMGHEAVRLGAGDECEHGITVTDWRPHRSLARPEMGRARDRPTVCSGRRCGEGEKSFCDTEGGKQEYLFWRITVCRQTLVRLGTKQVRPFSTAVRSEMKHGRCAHGVESGAWSDWLGVNAPSRVGSHKSRWRPSQTELLQNCSAKVCDHRMLDGRLPMRLGVQMECWERFVVHLEQERHI